ncbi:MAG TPA: tetratricopeptide repeat protein [Rhizomicrobium sp.]|jgi:tetratricopeptide (TPR) repeat protein|nr:tetratricopeptide repeat protein [Rhizomicrobium sp.]
MALAVPVQAQDALILAFNRCLDASQPPDNQIKACNTVVNAQGLEPDEMGFAYTDLGMALGRKGNDNEALAAFSKALELQPNIWQAQINRAFLYLSRGQIEQGLADYNAVVKVDPAQEKLFLAKAGIGYRTEEQGKRTDTMSDEREAASHTEALEKLKAGIVRGYALRCQQRAQNGLMDSALSDCNTALQLDNKFAPALALRGMIELKQGNAAAGNADMATAVQIDPSIGQATADNKAKN